MIDLMKLWESMPPDVQKKISLHDLKRTCDTYNDGPTIVAEMQFEDLCKNAQADSYRSKLIALMDGLRLGGVDKFLSEAEIGDYFNIGAEIYSTCVRHRTEAEALKKHFDVDVTLIEVDLKGR